MIVGDAEDRTPPDSMVLRFQGQAGYWLSHAGALMLLPAGQFAVARADLAEHPLFPLPLLAAVARLL
ncbi:hypothetical protein [Streptomyces sp. NPDC094472]|uniref:hypothetical protein n=1 Tax=unclassified Streptomyces TaxID=2593676 RepID=UPI003333F69D